MIPVGVPLITVCTNTVVTVGTCSPALILGAAGAGAAPPAGAAGGGGGGGTGGMAGSSARGLR